MPRPKSSVGRHHLNPRFYLPTTLLLAITIVLPFVGQVVARADEVVAVHPLERGLPPSTPEIDRLIDRMSIEAKVAQTMVVAFTGEIPTTAVLGVIDDLRVGGVILFQDNVGRGTPRRVRAVVDTLQARARQAGDGIPLLVAVDQEGGAVVRVGESATLFPGAMALGATDDEALVSRAAGAVARELLDLGINVNLGPVVDVNSNPLNPVIGTRSFGGDVARVSRLAAAAIRGQQHAGVLAIAKHWPGHGDAAIDSHLALPTLALSRARLDAVESPPFRAAVMAGVGGVMTAHLDVPIMTVGEGSAMPVSLSAKALAELRNVVGEDRLIVSDDLEMGAIVTRFGTADAAVRAFVGGTDLLLFRRDPVQVRRAHATLTAKVRQDAISMGRLDASVRRILRAKAAVGLFTEPIPDLDVPDNAVLVAAEVAQRSITVIQSRRVLPLFPTVNDRICVIQPRLREIADQEIVVPVLGPATLGVAVNELHTNVRTLDVGLAPTVADRTEALACARGSWAVVIGTYNAPSYPTQADLMVAVKALSVPVIAVALRAPYDFPIVLAARADAFMTGYGMRPATLQALTRTLFGEPGSAPVGRLPVSLDATHPVGWSYSDLGAWLFP